MFGSAAITITGSSFAHCSAPGGVSAITVLAGKLIEVWQAPSMRRISITLNSSHALRLQLHTHLARPFFQAGDTDGIMELLTDSNVEARLLERVQKKASTYGQEIGGAMQHDERRSRFPP